MTARLFSLVLLLMCCAAVVRPATAPAAPTATVLHYTGLGPRPLLGAVHFRGHVYSAGMARYEIGPGTVPAYSLTLGAKPALDQPLHGMDPTASEIPGLAYATYVATCSAAQKVEESADGRAAAAHQVAIWHFTSGLPLKAATVTDREVLRAARTLAARAEQDVPKRSCPVPDQPTPGPTGLSTAAYAPEISVASDETLFDQIVTVTLRSGSLNQFVTGKQALEVRINGVSTFVCTGVDSKIDTGEARFRPIPKECGKKHGTPKLQYEVSDTSALVNVDKDDPRTKGHEDDDQRKYTTAVIRLPRRGYKQQITVLWNNASSPGVVYVAPGAAASVITAGVSYPNVDAELTVKPATLAALGGTVEGYGIALILGFGLAGLFLALGVFGGFRAFQRWGLPRRGKKSKQS